MMSYQFETKENLPSISELPNPFLDSKGMLISNPSQWSQQRLYLKEMLAHYLYGHMPTDVGKTTGEIVFSRPVYDGRAIAETISITSGRNGEIHFEADIIRPAGKKSVPVITWNQFTGRHGSPYEENLVCVRGYAIAEFDKEQLAPDNAGAIQSTLAKAYPECDWGAIAMWAWGHSRLADYLMSTDWADSEKLVATGHSRGGKVALCAAIYDERFAVCAPNGSGCGGCGSFRYLGSRYGEGTGVCETAGSICDAFAYWWSDTFSMFGARSNAYSKSNMPIFKTKEEAFAVFKNMNLGKKGEEDKLPFDMHFARALIAPRAIISTDGLEDMWANTYGTQVNWRAAQEVFDFLGVPTHNAMHFREGKHEFQQLDWMAIADFCDEIFYGKTSKNNIISFRSPQKNNTIEDDIMQFMDIRNIRQHYSWRAPKN